MKFMDISPVGDRRPLAVQVYDRLYDTLMNGAEELVMLPTEEELVRQLAVSRTTVRQALALLEEDGVIERGAGRRRQVAHRAPRPFGSILSIEEMVQNADEITVERIVRRVSPATGWSARLLELEPGQVIATWESIVRAGGKVVANTLEVIESSNEPSIDGSGTMYAGLGARYRQTAKLGVLRLAPSAVTVRKWPSEAQLQMPLTVVFTTHAERGPRYLAKHQVDLSQVSLNLFAGAGAEVDLASDLAVADEATLVADDEQR